MLFTSVALFLLLGTIIAEGSKKVSLSTSSLGRDYFPGDLIFEDEFDFLNTTVWQHEVNMNGGGNNEAQIYDKDPANSYTRNGILYLKPTLTSDKYGKDFIYSGTLKLKNCTDDFGCATCCGRTAKGDQIMNPVSLNFSEIVISARIRSKGGFSFKYGRVEVRARISLGDWIWPAIWLLPEHSVYGQWPKSGEIDMMESRGNDKLFAGKKHLGVEQIGSTLHYGPQQGYNGWEKAHYEKNSASGQGYDQDYHLYQLEWTPDHIKFSVDRTEIGTVNPPSNVNGFFKLGGFPKNVPNPWKNASNLKMAPFDQPFHFVLNVAVAGNIFPDGLSGDQKPWSSSSKKQFLELWKAKDQWYPSWKGEKTALAIDYIRVYAI